MSNIKKDANQSKVIPFSKIGKIAVAVACVCVTTTVTAYAIGVLKSPAEVFSPIFGVEAEQIAYTELIDNIGTAVGLSSTSNGVTITLDGIIGDKNNAYVVYTITNEDGSKIEVPEDIEPQNLISGAFNGTQLPDNYTNWHINIQTSINKDGHLQYIEKFTIEDGLPIGEMLTSEFTMFRDFYETFIIEGDWKIDYLFDYQDPSIVIDVNESFSKYNEKYDSDITYKIKSVRISPISIVVNWSANDIPELVASNIETTTDFPVVIVEPNNDDNAVIVDMTEYINSGPSSPQVSIHQKDGSIIDTNVLEFGGYIEEGFVENQTSSTFEEIILLEDIDKIQVGDIFVPMP